MKWSGPTPKTKVCFGLINVYGFIFITYLVVCLLYNNTHINAENSSSNWNWSAVRHTTGRNVFSLLGLGEKKNLLNYRLLRYMGKSRCTKKKKKMYTFNIILCFTWQVERINIYTRCTRKGNTILINAVIFTTSYSIGLKREKKKNRNDRKRTGRGFKGWKIKTYSLLKNAAGVYN